MSLIRWFRKNNKRLIAVFVVLLMIAFLMPTLLQRLARQRGGKNSVLAYFGKDKKITAKQLMVSARNELNILKSLRIDQLLDSQRGLHAPLLGQLLFYEQGKAARLSSQLKNAIQQTELRISAAQIDEFFEQRNRQGAPAELYWLLLKAEAIQAGIAIPPAQAKRDLTALIPQLTGRGSYQQVVGAMVNRQGVPEDDILRVYSDLLAVLSYSQTLSSAETITTSQLMHSVMYDEEKLDLEFVRFDASVFAANQPVPSQAALIEHFEKYREFMPGQISAENPYGFGYKLPDMVQLEYIALRLDDVAGQVERPTEEDKEEYYQANKSKFVYYEPIDPNDPNSEKLEKTRSYAEMAHRIAQGMLQNRISAKAEAILNEARLLTEAGFDDVRIEQMDSEEFRQLAGHYADVTEALREKYGIRTYTGQTGLLSAEDLVADTHLGMLYVVGPARLPVSLIQIVFAIDELGSSRLGPFDAAVPRMYENIGPMKDFAGQILALVRVIDARKASEPKDINQTYSKKTLRLDEDLNQSEGTYLIKDMVVDDVKLFNSVEIARTRAADFARLAQADGWGKAIEQFNKQYGPDPNEDSFVPETFRLHNLPGLKKVSRLAMKTYAMHNADRPMASLLIAAREKHRAFVDKLYSLLPKDETTVENLPIVFEYKPYKSFYVIKTLLRTLVNKNEYEKAKAGVAFIEDGIISQSLALVHFSPENIFARTNYRPAEAQQHDAGAEEQATTASGEL